MEGSGIMTNVEGATRDLGPGAEQSELPYSDGSKFDTR
jgi:hypothetical protein